MRRRSREWFSQRPSAPVAARTSAVLELQAARTILERIEVAASATTETNVFRREGDYWSVVFEGRTVRVRDLKGMRYLAQLLAHPGREFHVLDLVAAETGQQMALGDAGEMLDERAKTAYRRRLAEIEDDIEQARALEDAEREAQADAERDFLVRELARAVGLGGRDRRAASASERARSGVTRAVRQGIARIGEHHPQLGEHLDRAVRTGTYCAYVRRIPALPRRGRRDVYRLAQSIASRAATACCALIEPLAHHRRTSGHDPRRSGRAAPRSAARRPGAGCRRLGADVHRVEVTLAADPVLGSLDVALDPGMAAAALAPHLPGLEGCHPRYARYRPGRQLMVLFDLDLEGASTLAHLTMLPSRRAERLWSRIEAAGLADRARRIPGLDAVLQLFPADVRLLGLESAMARGPAELVRYKPGRRAVLRYVGARVVYGKLRADTAGALHVKLGRRLIEVGVPTPAPLGYLPDLRMTLHEEHRGTRLAELGGPDLEAWMEPVAAALTRLHATSVPGLPSHSMQLEIEDLRAAADTAAALLPHRRADVDILLARLVVELASVRPAASTIHGSFHDDQVLVGDDGVALLDLDSVAVGDPLLDVGHFASYLSASGETAARERFLDAWGRRRRPCSSRPRRCCAGAACRSATSNPAGRPRWKGGWISRSSAPTALRERRDLCRWKCRETIAGRATYSDGLDKPRGAR